MPAQSDLTSALSGPGTARPARSRRDNGLRACGALAETFHGPLQRIVRRRCLGHLSNIAHRVARWSPLRQAGALEATILHAALAPALPAFLPLVLQQEPPGRM